MKTLVITLIAASFAYVIGTLFLKHFDGIDWEAESEKISPNKAFALYQYQHLSDGDRHAPYGTYIFMRQTTGLNNPRNGHLIFAGYCNEEMSYSWSGNGEINISCHSNEPDNIKTLSNKAFGIQINLGTAGSMPGRHGSQ